MHTFERYLTVAEERQLLRSVGKQADIYARRDHAWMRLLRQTGIRVQALSKLTVHDARQALFSKHLQLDAEIQKRGIEHKVFVTRKAQQAIKDLLAIRREMGHAEHPDAPLIVSRNNRGLSVRSFQARMQHWCRVAGLEVSASPHWWRHTVAKRLIASSTSTDPLGIVQSALGHKSRNSTAIYAAPDRESVMHAMEAAS